MNENHIINLLENVPFTQLSENDEKIIRTHIAGCATCRHAYEAAQISSALLKERAEETFEPSPFFQTRVLAQLRERETAGESWSFWRLWRSAGVLASSMVLTVGTLGILTLMSPSNQNADISSATRYSAEAMILNQNEVADDLASDTQVLTTLYGAEEDSVK